MMFMSRFKRLPFIEASKNDKWYRHIIDGTFQISCLSAVGFKQNDEIDTQFMKLVTDMLAIAPETRPSMKDILDRPIWSLISSSTV
jgi:hypothetical protein